MIRISRPECPYPVALANNNYKHPLNKQALLNSTYGKCMYCESKILAVDYGDVEHILPKAEGRFPHLEFDWGNLGIACGKCNNSKSDQYNAELPYVNPYEENPSDYLVAEYNLIFSLRGCERGALTINDIELNRVELIERRKTHVDRIRDAVTAVFSRQDANLRRLALAELAKEANPDKEYSFVVETLLRQHRIIEA